MASWTLAQLENLEQKIATGVLEFEFEGKRSKYRSIDDMMKVATIMRKALGVTPKIKRYRMTVFKGLTSESV